MGSRTYQATSAQIERATARARATFKFFWRELSWEYRRIVPAFDIKCVKVAFEDGDKVEHMWVGDVDFDGERVTGTLMNEPNELENVHEGDAIDVPLERVEDWMLAGAGGVLGAFTVQAMRAGMTKSERKEHDEAWGLTFGDPKEEALPPTGDDHPMGRNAEQLVEEFLDSNPSAIDEADDAGRTMLHREVVAGNANLVRALLARGANVGTRTKSGKTALGLAREVGWAAVEQMLLRAAASK